MKRYILSFYIPTAQYQVPTIRDPLTGKTTAPPDKPEWLTNLELRGAVVEIRIEPANERKFAVIVEGGKLPISPLPAGMWSENERVDEWPHLQR